MYVFDYIWQLFLVVHGDKLFSTTIYTLSLSLSPHCSLSFPTLFSLSLSLSLYCQSMARDMWK